MDADAVVRQARVGRGLETHRRHLHTDRPPAGAGSFHLDAPGRRESGIRLQSIVTIAIRHRPPSRFEGRADGTGFEADLGPHERTAGWLASPVGHAAIDGRRLGTEVAPSHRPGTRGKEED